MHGSFNLLKKLLKTATFRQSSVTITGSVINGGLGAFFYVLVARFLGPSDFGLLIISITTLTLISDIADFGTNTGLIRFVSANIIKDKSKALKFLKLSLELKLLIWVFVIVFGFFTSPFIADKIFGKPELLVALRLVMVGVGGSLLFSFATSSLQALQKFFFWSIINITSNLLRLSLIILLLFYQQLSLENTVISYIILPFLGFFFSLLLLPTRNFLAVKDEKKVAPEFFKFSKWVGLFTIIAAVTARLDTFISARLLSSTDVGIYGAANQLVTFVPQLVAALGTVAAPKFSSFDSLDKMVTFFKKFQMFVFAITILGLLAIPLSFYFIPLFLGQAYSESIPVFIVLLFGMLVFLISVPVHNSIIYYFAKPQLFLWLSVGHLLIVGFLGYFMILNFGVMGAAFTVLAGNLFNFVIPLFWFLKKIRR